MNAESINAYITGLEDNVKVLESKIRLLTQELDQERDKPRLPPEVDHFIDLVAPHVERNETMYDLLSENRAELVRAYRKIRPKGEGE